MVKIICSVLDITRFCLDMNICHYFPANSFVVYFTTQRKIIDHAVYFRAQQKGATWILMGATRFLLAGCPMGNLNMLGVVKACGG